MFYISYFYSEISKVIARDDNKNFWIGANDLGREGSYRMVNGTVFEINSRSLYRWGDGKPDNCCGGEDCLHIWTTRGGINDAGCTVYANVGADGKYMHGICEIPKLKNCKK